ncbi:2-C-methyl-D-erythritol 2,4-cyclodiphosphate synthase [Rhodoglobus vestalii]|uniref:Bifunctional enzyme IspD/IspF n=1 Tax=Rhodoglobus vestalii TaxID=193384 RepID=A0A8H2K7X7_9MICO|nr:2-C-methyl-D-erythritol 4-phosphate cytidylyltransferase [Rhodoglobus vestalii]TQO20549.1 2-C-methyl-D-erythritol 2,4-cyclodiphosphate synthase [Rhodoglobus vestalii]
MSSQTDPRVAVIVLGAGNGTRLGRNEPKAFVHLAGRPTLSRALESVFGMAEPAQVIIAVPQSFVPIARQLALAVPGGRDQEPTIIVGGSTRQKSVAAALKFLEPTVEVVLVHDAARPLTPSVVFDSVAAEVRSTNSGVVPGLPVADTIKRTDDAGRVVETVDRSVLMAVQTPQGFPREHLVVAHEAANAEFTDDSALVAAAGYPVSIIAGDHLAFKITTAWELRRAEHLFTESAASGIRVGTGTDVHAYDDTKQLWLAGLHWPDEIGLRGHSDGDVVAHAICDAMLSAAKLGDLGSVFGTNDPRFKDAHGDVFLNETLYLIRDAGFEVGNVSVQLIGNHPMVSRRRVEAEELLSGILGASVSIAGTTSDALGFTGRGEGMAAIATALVHARTPAEASHRKD